MSHNESVRPINDVSDEVPDAVIAPSGQGGDNGSENSASDSEEGFAPNVAKLPKQPTREEIEERMITHIPFRSWCPHCVRGKCKGKFHKSSNAQPKEILTVALEYMYMHESQEECEGKGMPNSSC